VAQPSRVSRPEGGIFRRAQALAGCQARCDYGPRHHTFAEPGRHVQGSAGVGVGTCEPIFLPQILIFSEAHQRRGSFLEGTNRRGTEALTDGT
jgi:hypothetical protein